MHFSHSARMWRAFPSLIPGLLVVDGLHPAVDVEPLLTP